MECIRRMEANIKINPVMRILGGLISSLFLFMMIFSLFSDMNIPIDVVISGFVFILIIAPVCIKGCISGKILDKLPATLVSAIKLNKLKG